MSEQRNFAERSLLDTQINPIMSADQLFTAAKVHALLAIGERLAELLTALRASARLGTAS